MKASELRIGNWIQSYTSLFGIEKWRQWQIMPDDMKVIIDFPENYSAIPLTEEWLLKFGFTKKVIDIGGPGINEPADEYSLDGYCFMFDVKNELFLTGYNWNTKHMKYFHQLQNLYFALTGEELNEKNDNS